MADITPVYPVFDTWPSCFTKDWREDFCTDCYFYEEDKDMGASIPWCCKQHKILEVGDCLGTCKFYISNARVSVLVQKALLEREKGEQ